MKDPAEIGFLLLLIASSIGAATYNYELVALLYGFAFVVLLLQRAPQIPFLGQGVRDMIVTIETAEYGEVEGRVLGFLEGQLRGLRQESVSAMEGSVSLHLRFRSSALGDRWGEFSQELNARIEPARAEVYVG